MNITLIAAIGKNHELGKDNKLIWSIPEDLNFFRDNTIGKPIIMGLNTLNSLPRLLPNRRHIVLTHREISLDPSIMIFHSIEELLKYLELLDEEVMVIGGAQIYAQMIEYANKMLLTEINKTAESDVYFPNFSQSDWNRELISSHSYKDIEYKHAVYTRKKSKYNKLIGD